MIKNNQNKNKKRTGSPFSVFYSDYCQKHKGETITLKIVSGSWNSLKEEDKQVYYDKYNTLNEAFLKAKEEQKRKEKEKEKKEKKNKEIFKKPSQTSKKYDKNENEEKKRKEKEKEKIEKKEKKSKEIFKKSHQTAKKVDKNENAPNDDLFDVDAGSMFGSSSSVRNRRPSFISNHFFNK